MPSPFSALKDISGSPSFQGGNAAPSEAIGGTSSASNSGDIVTGGSNSSTKLPSIYWIGAALLIGAIVYRIAKKSKGTK